MGVVSGLVMAYQFGTNWSFFSDFAGSVTGPLLAYEVLTAFFLEAGFLGVMLFGWSRVGPGLHFFATAMVSLGTLISATWILASNSWMQTPQGHDIVDGRVVPIDWLAVIFNPSFPYRLAHMSVAAFLATALIVGASRGLASAAWPGQRRLYARCSQWRCGWCFWSRPYPGGHRRFPRAQYARASAGQNRGDRRALGEQARGSRAADPVRLA